MIRLVFPLRRKSDMTREEFQDYWLRSHAPLVAGFANDMGLLRYVQTHTITSPMNQAAQAARGDMEPEYDGVAELWWASEKALMEDRSDAIRDAGAALLEDEQKFIDLPKSPIWYAYEYPQVNPSPETILAKVKSNRLRVFYPLRHKQEISEADARHYWLTHHGPIVRSHAEAAGTLCYRQVHRANSPMDDGLQKARGTEVESYLGHAEAWLDAGAVSRTEEAAAASQAFIDDEHNFIDMQRSTIFYGKEHQICDYR